MIEGEARGNLSICHNLIGQLPVYFFVVCAAGFVRCGFHGDLRCLFLCLPHLLLSISVGNEQHGTAADGADHCIAVSDVHAMPTKGLIARAIQLPYRALFKTLLIEIFHFIYQTFDIIC